MANVGGAAASVPQPLAGLEDMEAYLEQLHRRGQLHRDIVVVLGRRLEAVGLPDGNWEQALAVGHAARELGDLLESSPRESF